MIKIGKICLLTEGEIFELHKQLGEIETKLKHIEISVVKNFKCHDGMIENVKRYVDERFFRIERMADIIMPTLPIAKRKALAKLFAGSKMAAVDKQANANVNVNANTNTESK